MIHREMIPADFLLNETLNETKTALPKVNNFFKNTRKRLFTLVNAFIQNGSIDLTKLKKNLHNINFIKLACEIRYGEDRSRSSRKSNVLVIIFWKNYM